MRERAQAKGRKTGLTVVRTLYGCYDSVNYKMNRIDYFLEKLLPKNYNSGQKSRDILHFSKHVVILSASPSPPPTGSQHSVDDDSSKEDPLFSNIALEGKGAWKNWMTSHFKKRNQQLAFGQVSQEPFMRIVGHSVLDSWQLVSFSSYQLVMDLAFISQ